MAKTKQANFELTPKEIVTELNKYVVGQNSAKRAIAIALRNRWRRKQVPTEIREEIYPHNLLMVGPTGVGKTEIARRIAKLVSAPFIKVEATKFTEVGYVGRDVDSIIRDLMDNAVHMLREKMRAEVDNKAEEAATIRIINILVGDNATDDTRAKFRTKLQNGSLDDKEIELSVPETPQPSGLPMLDIPGMPGGQMGVFNIGDMLSKAMGGTKTKQAKMSIKEAREILIREESDKLVDEDKLLRNAIHSVENDGIVFLDEIDKICSRSGESSGGKGEVSREGVQRDLLPLIEGTTVTTKYGSIKTDHILFIASGAFHLAKPSDMLPELQGRLPIRVELGALSEEDLVRILKEPQHSLLKQYTALMKVEKVQLEFKEDGIKLIAKISAEINKEVENIGARRLHTILEKLLEGLSFTASELAESKVVIDKKYVETNLAEITKKHDLSKFIL